MKRILIGLFIGCLAIGALIAANYALAEDPNDTNPQAVPPPPPPVPQPGAFPHHMGMGPGFQPPCFGGPGFPFWEDPGLVKKLNLSTDQIAKIKDLEFQHAKAMIKYRADHELAEIELHKAMDDPSSTEKTIRALAEKIADIEKQILINNVVHQYQILNVLTPAQRANLPPMAMKPCPMKGGMHHGQGHGERS